MTCPRITLHSIRVTGIVLAIICNVSFFCACKHKEQQEPEENIFHTGDDAGSVINDRLDKTLKDINELIPKLDVYKAARLRQAANEVKTESEDAYQYYDRWERRIIAAAGGLKSDGQPKNGADTLIATKLLVTNNGGDTLKWHIAEMREMLLKQVRDTSNIIVTLPETLPKQNAATDWKTEQFNKVSVIKTLNLLEKYKGDARSSELIVLNELKKEYRKRR